jgi:hypothetical protein
VVELTVFLSTNQTGEEFFARYQGGADHFFDGDAFLAPEQRVYLLVTVIDVESQPPVVRKRGFVLHPILLLLPSLLSACMLSQLL